MSDAPTWSQLCRQALLREVELLRLHLQQLAPPPGAPGPRPPGRRPPAPIPTPGSRPRRPPPPIPTPGTETPPAPSAPAPTTTPAPESSAPASALDLLCDLFGLDDRARNVLVLSAGVEIDDTFAALCRRLSADGELTLRAVLGVLPEPEWNILTPNHALRYWQLIEIGPGDTLTRSPLRIDEAILHYLVDGVYWDPQLDGVAEGLHSDIPLVPSHAVIADDLARLWASPGDLPTLQLIGNEADTLRAVATEACLLLRLTPLLVRLHQVPTTTAELKYFLRRADRLVRIVDAVVVLDTHAFDTAPGGDPHLEVVIGQIAERLERPPILCGTERRRPAGRPLVSRELDTPTAEEQAALWRAVLGVGEVEDVEETAPTLEISAPDTSAGNTSAPETPTPATQTPATQTPEVSLDEVIRPLVAHFDLGPSAIVSAAAAVRDGAGELETRDLRVLRQSLWQACRAQSRPRLEHLAQRIISDAGWNDLVLPPLLLTQMREIVAQVRQRDRVYRQWGMGRRGDRGLGVTALFAGQSGTGKTFSAEVMANTLDLDLYRIDLSAVIDKYIGETEKNLRQIFDAAESAGAVLLFDEADALFGKRSQVQQSHDRWANIEVGYLLQRMESYRGLAILTTNLQETLDQAFLRRLRFVLEFPFPDFAQRRELWSMALPPRVPTEGLDIATLARLDLTGGQIRNAALTAAFLAAEEGQAVAMRHMAAAARREYQKAGRPLSAAELRQLG